MILSVMTISSRKRTYTEMDQSSESEQLPPNSIATLSEVLGESNPIQSHPSQVIVQQPLPLTSIQPQTSQVPHLLQIVIHQTPEPPLPSMIQTLPSVHQQLITSSSTVSSLQQQQQQQ